MITDPISEMLNRIKNAYLASKSDVVVPYSEINIAICKILKKKEFIIDASVQKLEKFKTIVVNVPEVKKGDYIPNFKRISKPGRRVYIKNEQIKPVNSGFGIGVISTPKGIMSSYEARTAGLGGEYLCEVY